MKLRKHRILILICVVLLFTSQPAFARKYRLRAKCRAEKRLSSELVLVRHAKSRFMGVCRDGKAVFDVSAGQERAMSSMVTNVDEEIPGNERNQRVS